MGIGAPIMPLFICWIEHCTASITVQFNNSTASTATLVFMNEQLDMSDPTIGRTASCKWLNIVNLIPRIRTDSAKDEGHASEEDRDRFFHSFLL